MRSAWFVVLLCSLLAGAVGLHVALHASEQDTSVMVVEVEPDVEDLEDDLEDELDEDAAEHCIPHALTPARCSTPPGVVGCAASTSAAEGWRRLPTRPPTA